MIFVTDRLIAGTNSDEYHTALGGNASYPMTLVLDARGIITEKRIGPMEYEELKAAVELALGD